MSRYIEVEKKKLEIWRLQSEVERLTVELEAIRGAANSYKMNYENAKTEVAREIFAEIEKKSCVISETNHSTGSTRVVSYQISEEKLAELKKKYTEVSTNEV